MKEEFEGSALRELFTPAVPVAAAAIASGPGTTGPGGTAKKPNIIAPTTSPSPAGTPTGATPTRSATPSPARTGAQPTTSSLPGSLMGDPDGAAALPKTPTVLASGTMQGRHWSVAAVGSGGDNAVTAKDRCLRLLISEDGHYIDPSLGDRLLYCVPGDVRGFRAEDLTHSILNGAGTMVVGTMPAAVAKVVAHVDGIAAPITAATVPAPGASDASIFIVPVPQEIMAHTVFDEYDEQGVKIGSWDNTSRTAP